MVSRDLRQSSLTPGFRDVSVLAWQTQLGKPLWSAQIIRGAGTAADIGAASPELLDQFGTPVTDEAGDTLT